MIDNQDDKAFLDDNVYSLEELNDYKYIDLHGVQKFYHSGDYFIAGSPPDEASKKY